MLSPHPSAPSAVAALCSVLATATPVEAAAATEKRSFNLPRGDAATTLKEFAAAAGIPIVYLVDRVRGATTNAVSGDLAPHDALERMLAGSGLEAAQDARTGAFVVSRRRAAPEPARPGEVGPVSDPQPKPKATPMKPPRTRRAAALFASWLAAIVAANSQTTSPNAPNSGQEIVTLPEFQVTTAADKGYRAGNSVSATRVNTPIADLPFSISAFTEQFIEDIGARELLDIALFAPGVTSGAKEFTQGNTRFSIRGFDGDVAPQRNGFVGNRYVDSGNIQRVEVVKGPSSLLYGQITPGGTVNYITKRPTEESFTRIKQQVGTDEFWRTDLDVNRSLADGRAGLRLVAAYENALGWAKPSGGDSRLLAGSAAFKLTPVTTLILDYENFSRQETPPINMKPNLTVPVAANAANFPNPAARARARAYVDVGNLNLGFLDFAPLPKTFNYPGNGDYRDSGFESLHAELSIRIGEHWTARANFGWSDFKISNKLTGFAAFTTTPTAAYHGATGPSRWDYIAELRANPVAILNDPAKTASSLLTRRKRLEESFGDSKTYQVELAGRLEFGRAAVMPLIGAYRSDINSGGFRRESTSNPPAGLPNASTSPGQHFQPWSWHDRSSWDTSPAFNVNEIPNINLNSRTSGRETAAYGLLNGSFLEDRLVLIGGVRWHETETLATDLRPTLANPPQPAIRRPRFESAKTTPQYGAGFKLRRDVLLFASYAESFFIEEQTLNSFNPAYNPALPSGPGNPLIITSPAKPVTGRGYEAGIKTDLLEGRVSSTVSVFHLERQDRVLRFTEHAPDGTFPTINRQGTVDESRGIELELTWSPLDNLQIFATFTRMDVRTTKATFPTVATVSADPAVQAAYVTAYNEARALILGAVPEGTAETLATFWGRYNFTAGALKSWWLAGGFVHTGDKAQRTANPMLFMDRTTIVDLVVGRDWKAGRTDWSASLSWKNVGDTEYFNANQSRGRPTHAILALSAKF